MHGKKKSFKAGLKFNYALAKLAALLPKRQLWN